MEDERAGSQKGRRACPSRVSQERPIVILIQWGECAHVRAARGSSACRRLVDTAGYIVSREGVVSWGENGADRVGRVQVPRNE